MVSKVSAHAPKGWLQTIDWGLERKHCNCDLFLFSNERRKRSLLDVWNDWHPTLTCMSGCFLSWRVWRFSRDGEQSPTRQNIAGKGHCSHSSVCFQTSAMRNRAQTVDLQIILGTPEWMPTKYIRTLRKDPENSKLARVDVCLLSFMTETGSDWVSSLISQVIKNIV